MALKSLFTLTYVSKSARDGQDQHGVYSWTVAGNMVYAHITLSSPLSLELSATLKVIKVEYRDEVS
ncbi:hypothetical protein Plhal304r1_c057g0143581 [Plasmopara halstedii]